MKIVRRALARVGRASALCSVATFVAFSILIVTIFHGAPRTHLVRWLEIGAAVTAIVTQILALLLRADNGMRFPGLR